jgi:poly(3-hydroxybutyrate) depolymerase
MKRVVSIIMLFLNFFITQAMGAEWQTLSEGGMQVHLYVPTTSPKLAGQRALMISLHGCAQDNEAIRDLGNWKSTADEYGMVVALPDVPQGESRFPGCWDYYDTDHLRTNRNNNNLINLVRDLIADGSFNIDENQVYISGLSSGGGQTGVMGCLAPDIFAGIGINAGPTIGTGPFEIGSVATTRSEAVSLCKSFAVGNQPFFETQLTSVIHGDNDFVVAQGYGSLNAQVMAAIYGASTESSFNVSELDGHNPAGTGTLWSDDKGPRVSLIIASGLDHAWPAGSGEGGTQSFVRASGVNYPAYLAEFFFANNRRVNRNHPPVVTITNCQESGTDILCMGTVTDEDAQDSIASLRIKFADNCGDDILIAETDVGSLEGDGSFSHSAGWPQNDAFYTPVIVATDSEGASTTLAGSPTKVGSPPIIDATVTMNEQCINVSGTTQQGYLDLAEVQVKVDSEDFEGANGTLDWAYEKCGLSSGKHDVIAKVSDVEGNSHCTTVEVDIPSSLPDCEAFTSSISTHVSNGRAYSKGWWFRSYYATGTDAQLSGFFWSIVILHENTDEAGKFYIGACD